MTEPKFKPLESTIRRQRFDKSRLQLQKRRQAFHEAWGDASDDYARTIQEIQAILVEDPRWDLSTKPHRIQGYAKIMKEAGWHLPNRYRGLLNRKGHGNHKDKSVPIPPSYQRGLIIQALLEGGPMTTQEILETESYPCQRSTLLIDLMRLVDEGHAKRSTKDYKGRGRGYQWTLVQIP